jgi:hypothetical protein
LHSLSQNIILFEVVLMEKMIDENKLDLNRKEFQPGMKL